MAPTVKVRCGPEPASPRSTRAVFAYPDLVIACGERRYHDSHQDLLLNPTVIIEIPSETTSSLTRTRRQGNGF